MGARLGAGVGGLHRADPSGWHYTGRGSASAAGRSASEPALPGWRRDPGFALRGGRHVSGEERDGRRHGRSTTQPLLPSGTTWNVRYPVPLDVYARHIRRGLTISASIRVIKQTSASEIPTCSGSIVPGLKFSSPLLQKNGNVTYFTVALIWRDVLLSSVVVVSVAGFSSWQGGPDSPQALGISVANLRP